MQHIFTWTIENFKACTLKYGKCLASTEFIADSLDETSWFVQLYPKGDCSTSEDFVSCFLNRSVNCAGPHEIKCDYTLEAIDKDNRSIAKHKFFNVFGKGAGYGVAKFFHKNSVSNSKFYSFDFLTIKVILTKELKKTLSKSICQTAFVTDKISFNWKLQNAKSLLADTKPISFPDGSLFEIRIEIPEDEVQISIVRKKGFDQSQILICSLTLLDLKGEEADSKETLLEADKPNDNNSWVFPTFLHKSKITAEKEKYLKEDYFTLKFDFALSNGKTVDVFQNLDCGSVDSILEAKENSSSILKKDFKNLLTNPIHADVKLHADEKVFSVHKNILCTRSPVFSAMFHQDMAENQTGEIHVSDIEAGTLNGLLEFIYTGDTEILDSDSALKLILASEKYEVLSLKKKSASVLELLLCDDNVCDILYTADLVQQESLKVCAVNHIKENSKKIFKSDEWKKLVKRNVDLATETVCEVTTFLAI